MGKWRVGLVILAGAMVVFAARAATAETGRAVAGVPTQQAEALGPVDFLKVATAFADCMLTYGRDRYGKVHSPLFSNILTREKQPRTTPCPVFADPGREAKDMRTPFRRFDFNKVLNYPGGLGTEGPHKVTLYGCDPYEDRDLYETLFELSRITGNPTYRDEAEKALVWWFKNTQGPAGLYPWGEHLGWDLERECPTYFDGPSKHLYAACYHEVKDTVPFLDILARLPAEKPGEHTPLEKYALGIWNAHFWDKEKVYFCRHGDYTGHDDRRGSDAGFPAHLAAYLRVWAAAYLNTHSAEVRKTLGDVLHKVVDMAVARTETYGFFPFTFAPELEGKAAGKQVPGQSLRLAHHAVELGRMFAKADPDLAARFRRLAELHLGAQGCAHVAGAKPEPRVRNLSGSEAASEGHATEILSNLVWYRRSGDKAYLDVARTYARRAYVLFCDDRCPLPKARAGPGPILTTQGEPFPDFYFHGAKLMKAFALVGEAERPGGGR